MKTNLRITYPVYLSRNEQKSSIEPAVYRFEYALKRIAELEQQLATGCCRSGADFDLDQTTFRATQQIKYQTYLGLSRCERKRKVSLV